MTEIKKPCACDYEACREVWKRVAPGEDPYPMADNANTQMSAQDSELTLPGAEADPCCMGSEAMELLAVLEGYIEEELEDRRRYLALSRQAPSWAAREGASLPRAERGREAPRARSGCRDLLNHRQGILPARVRGAAGYVRPLRAAAQPLPCGGLCGLQLRPRGRGDAGPVPQQAVCGDERGRIPPRRALDEAPRAEDERLTGRKKRSRRNPAPLCCAWVIRSR